MSHSLYMRLRRRFGPRISGAERKDRIDRKLAGLKAEHPVEELLLARPTAAAQAGKPKLIVVGAGFAGLVDGVVREANPGAVLEASDRVGGGANPKGSAQGRMPHDEGGDELIGYAHKLWMEMAKNSLGLSWRPRTTIPPHGPGDGRSTCGPNLTPRS